MQIWAVTPTSSNRVHGDMWYDAALYVMLQTSPDAAWWHQSVKLIQENN
jgi:hypothetical protein